MFFIKSLIFFIIFFFFSSRRRHTISDRDWSSDVCSSDLTFREDVTNRFLGAFTATYSPVNWFNMDANFSYDLRRSTAAQINDKGFRTTVASAANLGSIDRSATGREALNGSINATLKRDFGPDLKSRFNVALMLPLS